MIKLDKNSSCGAIIIVRLKSKRLKDKALLKINRKNSIIEYIIIKLKKIFSNENIVLATSHKNKDEKLILEAKKNSINFFQGEAIDVLKRIYLSASENNFTNVFVCTGDNPMFDLIIARKMINIHIKNKRDFTYAYGMPLGTYGWVLRTESIRKVLLKKKRKDTEIWGDFFLNNKNMKCAQFLYKQTRYSFKKMRLTIDEKTDLMLVKKLLVLSKKLLPSLNDIEKILLKNQDIIKINSNVKQKKKPKNIY